MGKGVTTKMKVEIRNDSIHIEGYVNVVERDSRLLPSPKGKFIEQVKAKTFQRALESTDNVDLLFNHDNNRKLGSTKEGNLQLWEDDIGLRAVAVINDAEVVEQAKNKKLTGWSFAFQAIKDTWLDGDNGIQRRYLEQITLPEVSILTSTPAYIATSIEMRDDAHMITEYRNTDAVEFVDVVEEDVKTEEVEDKVIDHSLQELELYILKYKHSSR